MIKFPDLSTPIPTAPDARRQAQGVHQDRLDKQRQEVFSVIRKAIQEGRMKANIPSPFPPDVSKELISKGYQISEPFQSDRNEYSVTVRW